MSKYTMAQVVTLTGINAHTLRKWETRYSLIEPERTETNIRYYSDSLLKKLLNISLLTKNGYRISKIDKMSEEDIHKAVANQISNETYKVEINALIASLLDMDEQAFDNILKTQIINKGLLTTVLEIVYPFLNRVGVLWGIDRVMPFQEHFVSNLIKKKMFTEIDLLPYPPEGAPTIVMFLIENEYHEIGLLLAYYLARKLGWKVYYLGQNVPLENINQIIQDVTPNIMLTMFITPIQKATFTKINAFCSKSNVPLYISGNTENIEDAIKEGESIYLKSPKDFVDCLENFK
ncbi:MerR family transcriptional regulator [Mangrovimonas spongiae]|uniref:MerR family transcriptional regulator n=1 Tax=Mangrovimonas spongiae TaxID=2494697 RepID=A0A3R9NNA4_9FLAO|nr:MerR family transcriptional regulator [Mangrovimonas spongiae]RSK39833.1 MerR family transcriptional regulator [Mangrovimonas spongiae]